MIGYWIGIVGMWVLSDGILSWTLYANAPSYEGSPKQTFKRDNWVRLIRIILGGLLIYWGWLLT